MWSLNPAKQVGASTLAKGVTCWSNTRIHCGFSSYLSYFHLSLYLCGKVAPQDPDTIGLADQSRYTGTESSRKPGEVLYTEFPGYTECYVDDTKDTIQLYNPESNSYYLSYSIFSTDDNTCVLEDTGLIEPGKAYLWKAAENLSKGDHNVYFNIRSFSMEDSSVEGTSTTVQNITVHVY